MYQLYFCLVTIILLTGLGFAMNPLVVDPNSSSTDLVGVEIVYSVNKSINQSFRDNNTTESQNNLSDLIPLNPDTSNEINFSTEVSPDLIWPCMGNLVLQDPEHPDAKYYLKKGNWYYNEPNKDYENALSCYEEGIKLMPNDASLNAYLWYGKGNSLLKLGNYDDSLAAYDKAISFKPDYQNAWDAKCRILKALHSGSSDACSRANAPG
jgi:tetratricopeptide (TPR) repeat protein